MTQQKPNQFFTKEMAETYDQRNRALAPISDNMHFSMRLVLNELPVRSKVLCVGVGTGAEMLSLATAFPEWTFVGVDPSRSMLDVCQERLNAAGLAERCQLHHGYLKETQVDDDFDAVVSVLVGHFVKRDERPTFYRDMVQCFRPGGTLIDLEISYDLQSKEYPSMLKQWAQVQSLMGATPESLAQLPKRLEEMLTILPNPEVEALLRESGILTPVRFFQSFMISGWYGTGASG